MNTAREVIDLKDSVELMNSADYKERFLAEYAQLSYRLVKLETMLYAWRNNKLEFTPTCPYSTYELQVRAMKDYKAVLEARAKMEGVDTNAIYKAD